MPIVRGTACACLIDPIVWGRVVFAVRWPARGLRIIKLGVENDRRLLSSG